MCLMYMMPHVVEIGIVVWNTKVLSLFYDACTGASIIRGPYAILVNVSSWNVRRLNFCCQLTQLFCYVLMRNIKSLSLFSREGRKECVGCNRK